MSLKKKPLVEVLPHFQGGNELTHLPLDKMATILADDILKHIFFNEKTQISIKISLKFVLKGAIKKIPALV